MRERGIVTQYTSLGDSLDVPDPPEHNAACVLGEPLGRGWTHVCSLCLYPLDPDDVACLDCGSSSASDDEFTVRQYTKDDCRCEIEEREHTHPDEYEVRHEHS
jgi:hypothetical protein